MAEETNFVGAYVLQEGISEEAQAVFDYAKKTSIGFGVDYVPKFVATQIVDGVNYLFICEGKVVYPNSEPSIYAIEIYTKFRHSVAPIVEVKSIEKCPIEMFLKK